MILGAIIGELLGKLVGIGGGAVERIQKRQEIQLEADTKIAVAKAEAEVARLQKSQNAEIDWDNAAVNQMNGSWKDEWFAILLSMPMILAFCGAWGKQRVAEGFAAISTAPDWYIVAFLSAIAASFGIRALVNRFGLGKK